MPGRIWEQRATPALTRSHCQMLLPDLNLFAAEKISKNISKVSLYDKTPQFAHIGLGGLLCFLKLYYKCMQKKFKLNY